MNRYSERLFVVRTWWESGDQPSWRASLRDARGQMRHFASVETLAQFLSLTHELRARPEETGQTTQDGSRFEMDQDLR